MCPVLAILPLLVCIAFGIGINWLFRKRKLNVGDKAVFITGCDRGFGETLASRLALEGYNVYAGCLDTNSEGANRLYSYSNIIVLHIDVTDNKSVDGAVKMLEQKLFETGLWAVVNNAGIAVFAETEWCTMDAYQSVLNVNLLGSIRVTKACLPLVRTAKGRVVNISSLAGRCALPGFTAYSASKFGLIGFSDSLRREMRKFDVKVISIEPKLYRTAISNADYHVQTNNTMWAEATDTVKLNYGDTYFRAFLDNMLEKLQMSSRRTYQVIDDLVHAVTARYPYTRYVPDWKMQILNDVFVIQPNLVQDHFLELGLKVHCTPFSMKKKKSS